MKQDSEDKYNRINEKLATVEKKRDHAGMPQDTRHKKTRTREEP